MRKRRQKTLTPTRQRLNKRKRKITAGLPKRRGNSCIFGTNLPYGYKAKAKKREAMLNKRMGVR